MVVRIFARHLRAPDPATEIPPEDILPHHYRRIPPHLYSPGEITALMAAATQTRPAAAGGHLAHADRPARGDRHAPGRSVPPGPQPGRPERRSAGSSRLQVRQVPPHVPAGQRDRRAPRLRAALLERQRQPAQLESHLSGGISVRVAAAVYEEPGRGSDVEDRDVHGLAWWPDRALASNQHATAADSWQIPAHRCLIRNVVEDQQPVRRPGGQRRVHRCHWICTRPGVAQYSCEPVDRRFQDDFVLRRELPCQPDIGQVTVRVLRSDAGLTDAAKPTQHHEPRVRLSAGRQKVVQIAQQLLPSSQQCWTRRQ